MTARQRPLCDCPKPCACYAEGYAAGEDKSYFEVLTGLTPILSAGQGEV